eukprot:CAMPEP_0179321560 /NCGR_PEP_ID=MMETSP0797-20121207/58687_1 /TAXON_ID=47934 /ORGANISM="Dinophysis acuminata, Strain DAEP01" /LENGTH=35 /DNA_ID= /DNA_START= /DNA_END= /DNA_ORIENTATION=
MTPRGIGILHAGAVIWYDSGVPGALKHASSKMKST